MIRRTDVWRSALVAACAFCFLGAACKRSGESAEQTYEMGVPASAGTLSYTVIDASWREAFVTAAGSRTPDHAFLVLNLTVTNGGAGTAGIPLVTLVGSDGKEYREEEDGEGVPGWFGTIRLVDAAQTEQGNVVFDVPLGAYKLRVSSGGDPEQEQTALINIPMRVDTPSSVGGGDSVVPDKK